MRGTHSLKLAVYVCLVAAVGAAAMEIGSNFWNLRWHASNDCFNNVNNVTGTNPWNPQFLQDLSPYTNLRFMDWDVTNNSTRSQWSQRNTKTNPDQRTVAYEWMIDLCNRTGCDMWVTLPHLIINRNQGNTPADYAIRLAILVKTGVDMRTVSLGGLGDLSTKSAAGFIAAGGVQTCEPLHDTLKLYLEYSNETWNSGFSQCGYCRTEGQALNLRTDATQAGYAFHGWAATRIFAGAEMVFGTHSPRTVNVIAGWTANVGVVGIGSAFVADAQYNPWGVVVDAVAIAPYMGGGASDLAGVAADIPAKARDAANHRNFANARGVLLLAYEGGQHLTTNAATVCRQAGMYDVYTEYLDSMGKYIDVMSHYNHVGDWSSGGAWGSMEFTGQAISQAHKYRALAHWAAAHPLATARPYVPVTAAASSKAMAPAYTISGRHVGRVGPSGWATIPRMLAPGVYLVESRSRGAADHTRVLEIDRPGP